MKNQIRTIGQLSRRKFLGTAATAAAAISVFPLTTSCTGSPSTAAAASKLNSKFGGVQIGCITYSFRDMGSEVETTLKACVDSGCSSVELMSTGIEEYLGAPAAPPRPQRPQGPPPAGAMTGRPAGSPAGPPAGAPPMAAGARPGGGFQRQPLTPEQQAAQDKYNADLKAWRLSVPMSKYEELRKKFNDAGVDIHIVKFSPSRWSDEEIDYAFNAAKAMGAKGITEEIGEEAVNKLGPIAEKHGMYAIFHQHMQFATEPGFSYDKFLAVSPAVMMNFDAGHFFGSTGIHPNTIIEKYHDRIFSIHLKDKTGPNTTPPNTNQVWGQGEMPIADVLLLLKEKKYPIYVDIELEYPVAPWSTSVKEVKTCVNYARQILI
jgi:sugar phosphate isomerase/epimerase